MEDGTFKFVSKDSLEEYQRNCSNIPTERTDFVKYFLYTPENPDEDDEIFSDYSFNTTRETRFIIHGWKNDYKSDVNLEIRKAFLDTGLYNVIVVDWSDYSMKAYCAAKSKVQDVGAQVAEFIDNSNLSEDLDKIAIIGHSLGAHCAGLAGRAVNNGEISAIWGLDPAFPLFEYLDLENRISHNDAKYVECIHTNGNLNGFLEPLGDVDYYVNGGMYQPGCGIDIGGPCSHSRSHVYFAESIQDNQFMSFSCPNFISAISKKCGTDILESEKMGYGSMSSPGIYYTPVNDKSPYGQGLEGSGNSQILSTKVLGICVIVFIYLQNFF